jgi:hypothetical protein
MNRNGNPSRSRRMIIPGKRPLTPLIELPFGRNGKRMRGNCEAVVERFEHRSILDFRFWIFDFYFAIKEKSLA